MSRQKSRLNLALTIQMFSFLSHTTESPEEGLQRGLSHQISFVIIDAGPSHLASLQPHCGFCPQISSTTAVALQLSHSDTHHKGKKVHLFS